MKQKRKKISYEMSNKKPKKKSFQTQKSWREKMEINVEIKWSSKSKKLFFF